MDDRPRNSIGDEDFDYGGQDDDDYGGFHDTSKSTAVQNQPHDEEVALSDTGSFGAPDSPEMRGDGAYDTSLIESQDMDDVGAGAPPPMRSASPVTSYAKLSYEQQQPKPGHMASMPASQPTIATGGGTTAAEGNSEEDAPVGYNPRDFNHLNVSDDVRELFKFIGRYQAHNIELDTKLKPFIPDYIPSVGSIDEFIKVPRPDGKPDFLGLKVLDEAAARQSDATVLTLQLRNLSKEATGNKTDMVGRIEHSEEGKAKRIQGWIQSINDIHKTKPAATVTYSRRMPDIDTLMQEWPPEMEAFLKNMKMPSGELDIDLKTFTKLLCGILDIPVYDNPIESLHVLFSLYLEFKSNPVFKQQLDMDRSTGGADMGGMMMGGMGEGMDSVGTPRWQGSLGGSMNLGASLPDVGGANVMTFN
ncbi:hypothetical protein CEUSTIGMA_g11737.t1 [Chlamydomonas eustigma]|uniref:Intraflagellar transport protein 46 homolog n=1 Tax=Chlamydomonas eustigma TaxID=1157962 RepID=A0A250XMJ4_9CHLO|nr:hypothetical protein CEUSTIGMA_g11737.t1 [Chlamydomonas eustigma]|eukprot:GAX84315.1 hypothetical protein CEUSTIGMA_g11737.t1 [Chlamydomonas eustigma]